MSKEETFNWKCDLCDEKITHKNPKGWVEISIANKYLDRSWTEKTICPSCIDLIVKKVGILTQL